MTHSRLLNDKWAAEAYNARHAKALKRDYGTYAPVGEMWVKQTRNAAIFPTWGMIATTLLRWRRPDGTIIDWTIGREGDVLIAPTWAMKR